MRPEVEQELAHTLLLELLAYQFASPVRWIETQDVLLSPPYSSERLVEIGPSPTLAGMAQRTLKMKYENIDAALSMNREVLCYSRDKKNIYYNIENEEPQEVAPEPVAAAAPTPAAAAPAAPAAAPAPAASEPVAAAAELPDELPKAVDVLHILVAQKLKKTVDEVSPQKAIKDLVGGKSTLQNEILGDLQKEFGSTPEKPEETPLDELGATMQTSFSGQLGKQSSSLISRMISSKMPGGFSNSAVRAYLKNRFGLATGRTNSVLLLGLTMEPAARIGSEAEAKAWLDTVAQKYASRNGITLSAPAAASSSGGGQAAVIDEATFKKLTQSNTKLVTQQLELFANYLNKDLRAGDKAAVAERAVSDALRAQLDLWNNEHGEFYASGISPIFSPLKARVYDSEWNWARQDALKMFYDIIFGRLKLVDREIVSRCIAVMNRANPVLLEFMQYHIDHCPSDKGATYQLAKELGQQLIDNCKEAIEKPPVFKDVNYPTAPSTEIDERGNLNYEEVPRSGVRKLEQYVAEMARGGKVPPASKSKAKVQDDLARIYRIITSQNKMTRSSKLQVKQLYAQVLRNLNIRLPSGNDKTPAKETIPFLHLCRKSGEAWEFNKTLTAAYLDVLENGAKNGITFHGKCALVTGAGAGSIGVQIVKGLLAGGARVIVTTSRYSRKVTEFYQSLFTRYGSRGSSLIVVPFNQASKQDVEALVKYIFDEKDGLGWNLDYIVPFAAIPENGREIDNIDSRSELAHRIMLTNVMRLLGAVKVEKAARGFDTRPAQVILPLSPNHGTFGNDGMYSESKLALEALFNRWSSESWSNYLLICGAVIGWTRGTGLMAPNNIVAQGIEKYGVRTFSQAEMAFNILGLMSQKIVNICQTEPVYANLNGGLELLPSIKDLSTRLRTELIQTAEIRKAVAAEAAFDHNVLNGPGSDAIYHKTAIQPRANLKFEFPKAKPYEAYAHLSHLRGMVDLERVAVVTGFSEVGPWGNSRTRWDMECFGEFSLEGCVELAWIMGLIKNFNGTLKNGKPYSGWVDAKTGEPVDDKDVKSKYESYMIEHCGIRIVESDMFNDYHPEKKELLQEVVIDHDLEPFEASKDAAHEFKLKHGDKVEIFAIPDSTEWSVRFKRGTSLLVPKALRFDRFVAGQIPRGWDPKRYGIPEDIVSQVDPTTLYVLVSTVEALVSSGITDPYECYKYIHVSELGNAVGSGVGGMSALRGMYKDRWCDKPVQKDILQESFINSASAWINMLLLSSSGPIKTPVGACATAVESVDAAVEMISSGKAKICIAGGFDDFSEEGSYEFANMGATSNSIKETERGRTPAEMSRPATTTRDGFMEAQGAGVEIVMQAKLAIEMGVPIYGIIGYANTAMDKQGRSVPAPGKGVLTGARELQSKFPSPLLDIKYRARQLKLRRQQISDWAEQEYLYLDEELSAIKSQDPSVNIDDYRLERVAHIKKEIARQDKEALATFGNDFWRKDPSIAPIRGALAVWGLGVDDIGVASFHGTSTVANEKNECDVLDSQLKHLNRSKGNPILGVFQKYLTGHSKGGAGAWMLNGVLQILQTGYVPGNRNADNIDAYMERFDHVMFPSQGIQTDGVRAGSVTAFGFGQVGGQIIAIHPDYVLATLDKDTYEAYIAKTKIRYQASYRYTHDALVNNNLFRAKDHPPYTAEQEKIVYLNPEARAYLDEKTNTYKYASGKPKPKKQPASVSKTASMLDSMTKALAGSSQTVGVDVELIAAINVSNDTFLERNFTEAERSYCSSTPNPQASYAGRWSAKEAVFKSLGVKGQGAGASLKDIEIVASESGAPTVQLHGAAKEAADNAGVKNVSVSISHDDIQSVSVAIAEH
ncbi:fatty acid synthase alpha subunit Lsd1 [Schizosaccharomyces japonicus yFS275]|uniref:Fatty acid synthase subunit alpha n=1 Tax=Schizosaccharomyces japonicus (strain yFS275 / FY16936) TaxID=402676 RepID=B6K892_SCHJY|nr:fatty acid synthase alpha subunit Lsd1 [Schizosaccharomyces japonicus yFS275]EEB09746.1 fatty acid synthase alpha subunit Lsd1 [Schizosaccharomyces japonicus yFS275]